MSLVPTWNYSIILFVISTNLSYQYPISKPTKIAPKFDEQEQAAAGQVCHIYRRVQDPPRDNYTWRWCIWVIIRLHGHYSYDSYIHTHTQTLLCYTLTRDIRNPGLERKTCFHSHDIQKFWFIFSWNCVHTYLILLIQFS